eukprot:CAMPEP_0196795924 /NCGR_PEP_ID=MMETSP1104-20130614/36794_1 /TAXON_ID=33652 /ORGANISM="Cafeteria sp., Strain Caron Lab Isolate" /LENGTH=134 /DNA_ID=CAMNT_0042166319 /DNA_START=230 /DNA_END=634 /DNA_ORIENTATION=-
MIGAVDGVDDCIAHENDGRKDSVRGWCRDVAEEKVDQEDDEDKPVDVDLAEQVDVGNASEVEDIDPSRKHGKDGEGERHLGEAELQLAGWRPASELVRADAVWPALMAVSMDAFPRSMIHAEDEREDQQRQRPS